MSNEAPVSIEALQAAIDEIENTSKPSPVYVEPRPDVVIPQTPVSPLALKQYVNVEQLKKDLSFELSDLDNAIRSHAALFGHYSNLSCLARHQADRMKATVEVLESKLYTIHREIFAQEGKKATEAQIDAAVKCDPRWLSAQHKKIDAKAIAELAGDAREAFAQRKDMLVQVSVDRRIEQQGEMRFALKETAVQDARKAALDHLAAQKSAA
jgi:hypothetical protein